MFLNGDVCCVCRNRAFLVVVDLVEDVQQPIGFGCLLLFHDGIAASHSVFLHRAQPGLTDLRYHYQSSLDHRRLFTHLLTTLLLSCDQCIADEEQQIHRPVPGDQAALFDGYCFIAPNTALKANSSIQLHRWNDALRQISLGLSMATNNDGSIDRMATRIQTVHLSR